MVLSCLRIKPRNKGTGGRMNTDARLNTISFLVSTNRLKVEQNNGVFKAARTMIIISNFVGLLGSRQNEPQPTRNSIN